MNNVVIIIIVQIKEGRRSRNRGVRVQWGVPLAQVIRVIVDLPWVLYRWILFEPGTFSRHRSEGIEYGFVGSVLSVHRVIGAVIEDWVLGILLSCVTVLSFDRIGDGQGS